MDVQVGSGGLCTILYFLSTPSRLITRVFGAEPGTGGGRTAGCRPSGGVARCGHGAQVQPRSSVDVLATPEGSVPPLCVGPARPGPGPGAEVLCPVLE